LKEAGDRGQGAGGRRQEAGEKNRFKPLSLD